MEARGIFLVGVVAVSPVTDLTLSGSSHERRAEADPYFTRSQAVGYVQAYLWNIDPTDPLAPPSLLS
jgi:acetyl esterase/lipase